MPALPFSPETFESLPPDSELRGADEKQSIPLTLGQ